MRQSPWIIPRFHPPRPRRSSPTILAARAKPLRPEGAGFRRCIARAALPPVRLPDRMISHATNASPKQ